MVGSFSDLYPVAAQQHHLPSLTIKNVSDVAECPLGQNCVQLRTTDVSGLKGSCMDVPSLTREGGDRGIPS